MASARAVNHGVQDKGRSCLGVSRPECSGHSHRHGRREGMGRQEGYQDMDRPLIFNDRQDQV